MHPLTLTRLPTSAQTLTLGAGTNTGGGGGGGGAPGGGGGARASLSSDNGSAQPVMSTWTPPTAPHTAPYAGAGTSTGTDAPRNTAADATSKLLRNYNSSSPPMRVTADRLILAAGRPRRGRTRAIRTYSRTDPDRAGICRRLLRRDGCCPSAQHLADSDSPPCRTRRSRRCHQVRKGNGTGADAHNA